MVSTYIRILVIWLHLTGGLAENACKVGFYNRCQCASCPERCTTCTSWDNCNSCKEGFYGESCGYRCDTNCFHTACLKDNGTCVDGCSAGYYQTGSRCVPCSYSLQNCEECKDAFYCIKCASGFFIMSHFGTTCEACRSFKWGYQCRHNCSSNCHNTTCNPVNGHCLSCLNDKYGNKCESQCSRGCNHGSGSNICSREDGQCTYGCKRGYSGPNCDTEGTPVDGNWEQWSDYKSCSRTCGSGTKSRSRSCNHPSPKYGGNDCSGIEIESTSCFLSNCPVDGGWGQWSEFTACSVSCGRGNKSRKRSCDQPVPRYGGHDCVGVQSEMITCHQHSCSSIDGQTEVPSIDDDKTTNGMVSGVAAGGGALLLIIVLALVTACVIKRKRARQRDIQDQRTNIATTTIEPEHYEGLAERPNQRAIYMDLNITGYESVDVPSHRMPGSSHILGDHVYLNV